MMQAPFSGFEKTAFFQGLPAPERLEIIAPDSDGCLEIDAGSCRVAAMEILDASEEDLWNSWKELFGYAIKTAEASLQGSFEYQLVTAGSLSGTASFQPANFAQWLINQARQMTWGETRWLPYAGTWGVFRKRVPLDWGKIRFRDSIRRVRDLSRLDLLCKAALEKILTREGPVYVVLHDLSAVPLFRFGDDGQTPRLFKVLEKYRKAAGERLQGVHYVRQGSALDFLQQFEPGPAPGRD